MFLHISQKCVFLCNVHMTQVVLWLSCEEQLVFLLSRPLCLASPHPPCWLSLSTPPWPRGLLVWASVYTETGALVNTESRSAGVWWNRLIHQPRDIFKHTESRLNKRGWHRRRGTVGRLLLSGSPSRKMFIKRGFSILYRAIVLWPACRYVTCLNWSSFTDSPVQMVLLN